MALALGHHKKNTRNESSTGLDTWQPRSELQQLRRDLDRLSELWHGGSLGLADALSLIHI